MSSDEPTWWSVFLEIVSLLFRVFIVCKLFRHHKLISYEFRMNGEVCRGSRCDYCSHVSKWERVKEDGTT